MQITYTLKLVLQVDDRDLGGESPKEYLAQRVDEDVEWLISDSEVLSHTIGKIVKDERPDEDEEDDDDGLTELDEDDLDF